jgi:hypothetical protein
MMKINKKFRIVFQPYDRQQFSGKRRFFIGAGSLPKYVGEKNAETAILKALNCDADKYRAKFRKHGTVDFYPK